MRCTHWQGNRTRERAYCHGLHLSGKDAPRGDDTCSEWTDEKELPTLVAREILSDSETEWAFKFETVSDGVIYVAEE